MKHLIRKLWIRVGQWLKVDYAELLTLREQTAVSLERAKVEYEQIVEQSIGDRKFGNVWFGSNHMPDDNLEDYILGFREQCGRVEYETYLKDTPEGRAKALNRTKPIDLPEGFDGIFMEACCEEQRDSNILLKPVYQRQRLRAVLHGSSSVSGLEDLPAKPLPKPLRNKVNGQWPIDANVGAIHLPNNRCYTGDQIPEYIATLNSDQKTDKKPKTKSKVKAVTKARVTKPKHGKRKK